MPSRAGLIRTAHKTLLLLEEHTPPSPTDVNYHLVFFDTDGKPYWKDSDGTEHSFSAGTLLPIVVSANTALDATYLGKLILAFESSPIAPITLTLRTAVGIPGQQFRIKRVGAALISIAATGGELVDGVAGWSLVNVHQYVILESDGTNWWVVGGN